MCREVGARLPAPCGSFAYLDGTVVACGKLQPKKPLNRLSLQRFRTLPSYQRTPRFSLETFKEHLHRKKTLSSIHLQHVQGKKKIDTREKKNPLVKFTLSGKLRRGTRSVSSFLSFLFKFILRRGGGGSQARSAMSAQSPVRGSIPPIVRS